jgi:transcriptional regulator with XRE-family HTH domain
MTTEFSRYVRRRRQELAKTQAEVAAACELTVMSITLLEGGKRGLALERVPRLADALQIAPAELCMIALRCRFPKLAAALITQEGQ